MNESFDELQQLAGEYVLGTLTLEQRQQLERRLPNEPGLRDAVDAWERRLLPLTTLVGGEQPSPQLWPRIAAGLRPRAAASAAAGVAEGWRRWWDDVRLWRGLAGGGVLAAVVLGSMVVLRPATPEPAYMVVLSAPQERTAGWVVQASLDRNITLTPLHGTEVPQQKALQFWTKGEGWSKPVSLGLVQPDKSLKLAMDKLPPLQPNQLFEITLEPDTGSPTGKPTGPVLYIGKAVKVM